MLVKELDSEEEAKNEEFKWQELLMFEKGFWLMAIDCLLTFSIIETTIAIGTDILDKLYEWPETDTGMFVTAPYLICGLLLIPLGWFVDKYGKRQTVIIVQGVITLSSFFIFLAVPKCQRCSASMYPWVFFGFGLTVYYVLMYGSVSYLVRAHQTGTAYGFITCF